NLKVAKSRLADAIEAGDEAKVARLQLELDALKAQHRLHESQLPQARLEFEQAQRNWREIQSWLATMTGAQHSNPSDLSKLFDKTVWDYGVVARGTKLKQVFKLRNTLSQTVHI